MNDPFLAAHEALPHVFVLADLKPTSIRDQILRAVRVTESLVQAGRIGSRSTIAVVGGGAAGAAAAMVAASHGSHVLLIDEGPRLFNLQCGNRSRFIQPVQYDWPGDHFAGPAMPFTGGLPNSPLPLQPGTPERLARHWRHLFRRAEQAAPGRLMTVHHARATLAMSAGMPALDWTGPHHGSFVFDEVIWATGRASENTTIIGPGGRKAYVGPPFWRTDNLLRHALPGSRVLVSGGGDGGCQDYLRAVLGVERFDNFVASLTIPPDVLHAVQSAEDRAFREEAWERAGGATRNNRLTALSAVHADAVRRSMRASSVRNGLRRALDRLRPDVFLVHKDAFPTAYYPLNRFLVALISHYLLTVEGKQTVFPDLMVVDVHRISGPGGVSTGQPACSWSRALGQWHRVTFSPGPATAPSNPDFNVLMVRHGGTTATAPFSVPAIGQPCQLLPYGLV